MCVSLVQSTWSSIVPGLPTKYPGGHVSLTASMTTLPSLDISAGGTGTIAGVFPFTFDFSVTPAGASTPVQAFDVRGRDDSVVCVSFPYGCIVVSQELPQALSTS